MPDKNDQSESSVCPFTIVDLNYVSLYYEDFQEAIAFYEAVFRPT